jgi:hypothetical protein
MLVPVYPDAFTGFPGANGKWSTSSITAIEILIHLPAHILAADGVFRDNGVFRVLPPPPGAQTNQR